MSFIFEFVCVVLILQLSFKFCLMCYIVKLYIIWMSICLENKKYFVSFKTLWASSSLLNGPIHIHDHIHMQLHTAASLLYLRS